MTEPTLGLVERSFPGRAVFDTAVSHAILRRVGSGALRETLRLYRPDDIVVFSLLDSRRPGFARAVELARGLGCEAVIRLGGGHAALFHRGTLAFSWARASSDPRREIRARFDRVAAWLRHGLRELGVDAHIGEVPGEYCPGEHSINARGAVKLVGVGQRVILDAAHLGGVISVSNAERIREVLVPIYRVLELEWDPARAGSLEDEIGAIGMDEVREALVSALSGAGVEGPGQRCERGVLDAETLALAAELERWHRPEGNARGALPLAAGGKTLGASQEA